MSTPYPWQAEAWSRLQPLRERLPHAILLHGAAGIGKADFIEHAARSLLCEDVGQDGHACGRCSSCGWFSQQNHPDFRRVRPEALEDEAPDGDEGEGEKKTAKAAKPPSKDIKIEQIRALADFMNISTHRQGLRIVALYPAEALNTPAANALLKTLEEPPPGTLFLLASNSLDRLLPTILSRCRKFAMPMPDQAQALAWLRQQAALADPAEADALLREQGGAPLAALALAEAGSREETDALLQLLAHPSVDGALRTADKLQKASLPTLVSCVQRWLYDVFSYKLTGSIRYYPRYRTELEALAGSVHIGRLMGTIKNTNERRAVADHPLSPKLFIEDMLLDIAACCR